MNPNADLHVSPTLIEFTKQVEEFRPKAYQDSAGIWTVGYGEAYVPPDSVRTPEQAAAFVIAKMAKVEWIIKSFVSVALNQNQLDALCDFVYNVGDAAFHGSTLRAYVNASNFSAAANEFLVWTRSGNVHPPGLLKRRKAERFIFLADVGYDWFDDAVSLAKD